MNHAYLVHFIIIPVPVMSSITATVVDITANLGGQMRHAEIRNAPGSAPES